jgi:hypothetical protein
VSGRRVTDATLIQALGAPSRTAFLAESFRMLSPVIGSRWWTDVKLVQIPPKKASGRLSPSANQTGGREPSGRASFSEKLVKGTAHLAVDAEPAMPMRRSDVAHIGHARIAVAALGDR